MFITTTKLHEKVLIEKNFYRLLSFFGSLEGIFYRHDENHLKCHEKAFENFSLFLQVVFQITKNYFGASRLCYTKAKSISKASGSFKVFLFQCF